MSWHEHSLMDITVALLGPMPGRFRNSLIGLPKEAGRYCDWNLIWSYCIGMTGAF